MAISTLPEVLSYRTAEMRIQFPLIYDILSIKIRKMGLLSEVLHHPFFMYTVNRFKTIFAGVIDAK